MPRPETKSAPIRAAWRRGYSAGMRGLEEAHNPHLEEGQQIADKTGWGRMYASVWHDGWVDGQAEKSRQSDAPEWTI